MGTNNAGLTINQENALTDGLISIIEAENLSEVWRILVEQIPIITGWDFCSIFLQKNYLDFDPNQLVDGNEKPISFKGDCVVLAHTNIENKKYLIGKAFYPSGIGLIGVTYKKGMTYLIEDVNDKQKMKEIDLDLESSDRYGLLMEQGYAKVSMLLVPLVSNSRTIGVLTIHTDLEQQSFSESELKWVSKLISAIVKEVIQKYRIPKQQDFLLKLAELSSKENLDDVFRMVSKTLKDYLECPHCEVYLTDEKNEKVNLVFTDGHMLEKTSSRGRGEGLIGWVFQTGRPLLIDDLHDFNTPVIMDEQNIIKYSDGLSMPIDEDARILRNIRIEKVDRINQKIPFLAVPIQYRDQDEILGVLCVHYLSHNSEHEPFFFSKNDVQSVRTFAGTLALAIHNDIIRRRNIFLSKLGKIWNIDEVLKQVVDTVPALIRATNCFVFLIGNGGQGPVLRLIASNAKVEEIEYIIGEGKTGYCGKVEKTVVFSHYGSGMAANLRLQARKKIIQEKYFEDLVERVYEDDKEVGIAQIWFGRRVSKKKIEAFTKLCAIPLSNGLASNFIQTYVNGGVDASFSFAATPIVHSNKQLDGVITVGRSIKGVPFTGTDIQFVEAVAANLGALLDIANLRKDSEDLYTTLAHEINTPITSIRANVDVMTDTIRTVLREKDPRCKQLEEDGKTVIRQVDYLQMLSDTIMTLQKASERKWSKNSIVRPIHEAIDIYGDYAKERGCEIHLPKAIGYPGFPNIEMAKFELILAFKNLIHNAIKYSYRTPIISKQQRFISIYGRWVDQSLSHYSISIQNYGVPITKEELDGGKIFQRGYRGIFSTDRDRRGGGIGLSLVKHVIEEIHNGTVTAISVPVEGTNANLTTFTVTLPVIHHETQGD